MMIVFTVITVFSAFAFAADMTLRYVLKIRAFGLERNFFKIRGKTIPIEHFIPNNLTQLTVFFLAFGASGLIYSLLSLIWYIALVFAVFTAFFANFAVVHYVMRFRRWLKEPLIDKNGFPPGTTAVCTAEIKNGGYGEIAVRFEGAEFRYPALSANENDIEFNAGVIIVDMNDGIYWVETDSDIFDILNGETEDGK